MQPPLFHRVLGEHVERVPAVILAVHNIGDGAVWHGRGHRRSRTLAASAPSPLVLGFAAAE
jgi:hypothetical protein